MYVRGKHPWSGYALFRALRSACVLDVTYDGLTPDPWLPGPEDGAGSPALRTDQHVPVLPTEPAATSVQPGAPAIAFDMEWDQDEPSTHSWAPDTTVLPQAQLVGHSGNAGHAGTLPPSSPPPPRARSAELLPPPRHTAHAPRPAPSNTMRPPPMPRARPVPVFAPEPVPNLYNPQADADSLHPWPVALSASEEAFGRRTGNPWLWNLAAAVALFGAGLATHSFLSHPRTSSVVIETEPADAQVSVDGTMLAVGTSPFGRDTLLAGEHVVLVQKPGFTEQREVFSIPAGQAMRLPLITLKKVSPPANASGFSISSTPPGAQIRIDGQPIQRVTPARVTGITPGPHALQLELEGYAQAEASLTVSSGSVVELSNIVLERESSAQNPALTAAQVQRSAERAAKVASRWRQRHGMSEARPSTPASRPDAL